jgi:hypothetical protein
MSYEGERVAPSIAVADPKDLEALVVLLEVGALYLTGEPGATFTGCELLAEARAIAGPELPVEDGDLRIVLQHAGFLKKHGHDLFSLK